MAYIIFDLDGTVIDTSHRYRNNAEGHCDLEFWFANSTPEMIALDALLPLADVMKRYFAEGHTIIVCTARDFSPLNGVDLGAVYTQFLEDNGLRYHHLLYRNMAGPDHETLGDGALKKRLLDDLAVSLGYPDVNAMGAHIFDDNRNVIEELTRNRVICYDAISYNKRLAEGKRMPALRSHRRATMAA